MINFLQELQHRNSAMFYFGLICLLAGIYFLFRSINSTVKVLGANAWFKPAKFAFSIVLYAWSMAWYCYYLPLFNIALFNWAVVILLGFEIVYIALQAARGQLSHYNISTPVYTVLYRLMAVAASAVALLTGYVAVLFFNNTLPGLPAYYLWGIRLGLILFIVFAFEGAVMGGRLSHTIGGTDGGPGLPFLNWSIKYGDPRVAHFIGMHALQLLPLLSYYVLKNSAFTIIAGLLYTLLAVFTLLRALKGKPTF
jgi:hypothetical protein